MTQLVQGTKEYRNVYSTAISQEIADSGIYTSDAIDLTANYGIVGTISLQLIATGDGVVKVEYLISADDTNYITPSSASEIVTVFTKTSGTAQDGKDFFSITPPLCKSIKLKFTETGTSDSITINAIVLTK